jgi:hypothetical protein
LLEQEQVLVWVQGQWARVQGQVQVQAQERRSPLQKHQWVRQLRVQERRSPLQKHQWVLQLRVQERQPLNCPLLQMRVRVQHRQRGRPSEQRALAQAQQRALAQAQQQVQHRQRGRPRMQRALVREQQRALAQVQQWALVRVRQQVTRPQSKDHLEHLQVQLAEWQPLQVRLGGTKRKDLHHQKPG